MSEALLMLCDMLLVVIILLSASEASDTYVFLVASVRLSYNAYSTCVSVISLYRT